MDVMDELVSFMVDLIDMYPPNALESDSMRYVQSVGMPISILLMMIGNSTVEWSLCWIHASLHAIRP